MSQVKFHILATTSIIAFSSPAYAYIDPGAGTLIVQGLIGSFVAITTIAGLYMQRIRAAFGRKFGKTDGSDIGDTK